MASVALVHFMPVQASSSLPSTLDPMIDHLVEIGTSQKTSLDGKIPIVGIGGCPGVGKTHVAQELQEELTRRGISCAVVHFDDWTTRPETRKSEMDYFDLRGIHHFFASIAEGQRQMEKPTFDGRTDEHGSEILDLRRTNLILFEGLFALTSLEGIGYFSYCDLGIYVDAEPQDIKEWKRARPIKEPRTSEEFEQHMEKMFNCHNTLIEPFKGNASWTIRKDSQHNYSLAAP